MTLYDYCTYCTVKNVITFLSYDSYDAFDAYVELHSKITDLSWEASKSFHLVSKEF